MKEQFVTYEIALKLKELCFNEPCMGLYYIENKKFNKTNYSHSNIVESNDYIIDAPLWQQVIDWFREKHLIIINIEFDHLDIFGKIRRMYFTVRNLDMIDSGFDSRGKFRNKFYDNLDHTKEQAILKAIEIIKENEKAR